MRFAFLPCPKPIPSATLTNFWVAFYFLAGRKFKIQDLDELHCLFPRGLEIADERMPFVGSASGRGDMGLLVLKTA